MSLSRFVAVSLVVLACSQTSADQLSQKQLRAVGHRASRSLLYAPKPDYPVAARARHYTGSGVFIIRVPVKSGRVTEARVAQSTGHPILDRAAVDALKKWRFKPGALQPIGEISPWRHDPGGKTDALLRVPFSFNM